MSIEQAKSFRDLVNADAAIQDELRRAINGENRVDMVALGRKHGYRFTGDEARQVLLGGDDELSDFELDMVQAGTKETGSTGTEDTGIKRLAGASGLYFS